MAREFLLPDIGEGLTEAEIVRWLVPEGGRVEADQPVVEVETDKAVVEIPSPYAGTVLRHGGVEGETIRVGSVLVVIGEEGEVDASAPASPEPEPTHAAAPIVGSLSEEAEVLSPAGQRETGHGDTTVKALPIVRKLARDTGVDLGQVHGSGPDGRITREDVLAAAPPGTGTRETAVEPLTKAETAVAPAPRFPVRTSVARCHGCAGPSRPTWRRAGPRYLTSPPSMRWTPPGL